MSISFAFWLARSTDRTAASALVSKGNYYSSEPGWRFFVEHDADADQWALYFRARTTDGQNAAVTKWLGDDSQALERWFHVTGG